MRPKQKYTRLFLCEATVFANVVPQVAPRKVVHDQVKVFPILECVIHVDDKRVIELCENLSFIHNTFETAFRQDSRFGHFLHGILLLVLFALDLPDLAEAALPDCIVILEIRLSHRLLCHLYIG